MTLTCSSRTLLASNGFLQACRLSTEARQHRLPQQAPLQPCILVVVGCRLLNIFEALGARQAPSSVCGLPLLC